MNIFKPALAYGVLLLIPCASSAQSSRTLIADAVFSEGFGMVSGLHELSDGRLMITDGLGQMLLWVEMDGGRMEQIGREGRGPEEYRTPDALYALAGDSTLMVDLGNGRLTVLGPDGEFIRTMPMVISGPFQIRPTCRRECVPAAGPRRSARRRFRGLVRRRASP